MSTSNRPSERTALLNGTETVQNSEGNGESGRKPPGRAGEDDGEEAVGRLSRFLGPPNTVNILLAGFIISLSFGLTQVPIFYAFYLIECDLHYETQPPFEGPGDRCSVEAVAAATSVQFSILGMATTFFGTWNLFVAGWMVKRWGPRAALVLQTLFPALRVAVQTAGVYVGGRAGLAVIQGSQVVTVLGGPAGYILVVNIMAGELVVPRQRTAVFGQLQGCAMLGIAAGYLLGGVIGDAGGIRMPFQVAFFLFCGCATYARLVLPYLSPEAMSGGSDSGSKKGAAARKGFLAPLRILAPQTIRLSVVGAGTKKHYGVLFLCCGIFLGVLATGYAPILLQQYAAMAFDFTQADNGWLMSGNALVRGFFLLFIFPRFISLGRRWWTAQRPKPATDGPAESGSRIDAIEPRDSLPTEPEEFDAPTGPLADEEPVTLEPPADQDRDACHFDLYFLRWSLVVDGALTMLAAFATRGWHMYLGILTP